MAVEIRVPELGESILSATVHQWYKQEGERVEVGEALLELETDKVNLEVGAEQAGRLAKIEHPAGDDVQVGEVLGLLEPLGEGDEIRIADDRPSQPEETQAAPQPAETGGDGKAGTQPSATPVAQRLASEQGIDLAQISGSGPGGRIFKEDVERFLEFKPEKSGGGDKEGGLRPPQPGQTSGGTQEGGLRPPQPGQTFGGTQEGGLRPPQQGQPPVRAGEARPERREKMSRRRRTIARRLVEAQQTAAMLTTFNEVDMGAVMALRQRHNPAFVERYGVKLGIVSFFIKAAIGALKAFPAVNAQIEGDELVFKEYYDIGVAIGAPEGLVVPVLRDADRLSFAAIETKIREFVEKTEQKTLALEDLQGGTFSITNGGVFGSLLSTPILNPPQSGILGLHKIADRPAAVDGQVVIRPMMYLALSYDHRIVDGREAVQFLVRVKELVEDPAAMLLEG
jgi:2-oxoglutarate dehydrogenase E2 component (dihydrolipoamide succinyltransferase)